LQNKIAAGNYRNKNHITKIIFNKLRLTEVEISFTQKYLITENIVSITTAFNFK